VITQQYSRVEAYTLTLVIVANSRGLNLWSETSGVNASISLKREQRSNRPKLEHSPTTKRLSRRIKPKNAILHLYHKKGKDSPYSITERRIPELVPGSWQSARR